MSSGLINSNAQPFVPLGINAHSTKSMPHQQSLASSGVLNAKQQNKALSKNIENVLNKLSNKVSSDKAKSKDSAVVAEIEQDIGTILSLTEDEGEEKPNLRKESSNDSQTDQPVDDGAGLKQEIVAILSVASDIFDVQSDMGVDESFTLSLIADLLGMLEGLMGITETSMLAVTGTSMQNGADNGYEYTSQNRFDLLVEYVELVKGDLIESGESRFSDVISLVDQQLEERRYRDREAMKEFSQLDYMRKNRV